MDAFDLYASLTLDTTQYEQGLKNAELATEQTKESTEGLGDTVEKTGQQSEESAKGGWTVLKQTLSNLATTVVVQLTDKIKELASNLVETGMSFESAMSEVEAISGATTEEMEAMEAAAKEAGSTTTFSASEAAEALKYMSLAGWDAEQSTTGLDAVLNLAAASGMELGTASDLVTDYLTAFGLEAEDASTFVDELAWAQSNSNTTVEQLGEAYQNCASYMASAGQTVETTTALLQEMADSGDKGSKAGTYLKAIVRDLNDEMVDGNITIGETTVAIADEEGNYRSLIDIIADIESATAGMAETERDNALSAVFTSEAQSGLKDILLQGTDAAYEYSEGLASASGTAEDMANTMVDNLEGSVTLFQSAMETLEIEIYEGFSGVAQELVDSATDVVGQLTEAYETEGVAGMLGVGADLIAGLLTGIGDSLPSVTASAGEVLVNFINYLTENMPQILETGVEIINSLVNGILQSIPVIAAQLPQVVLAIVNFFAENGDDIILAGMDILTNLVTGILDNVTYLLENLPEIITSIVTFFTENKEEILQTGRDIVTNIATGLGEDFSEIGAAVGELVDAIPEAIDSLWSTITEAGANIVNGIAEGISGAVGTATNAIGQVASDVLGCFTSFYDEQSPSKVMEEYGGYITEGLALGIEGETRTAEDAATSVAESTLEAIEEVIDADVLRDDGANAVGGLVEGIREESEVAIDAAETMATEVGEALEGTSEAVAESLTETDELLAEATETQISNLTTTIETVQSIVDEAFATETESVDETVELITEQLDALAESYTEVYESMQSSIEGQASLWDEMEEVTAMSSEDIESALQSQINYWTEYEENLLNLQSRGIEGLNEFVSSVNDGSTQAAAYIAGLAQMSDEQLMYLVNTTYPTLVAAQDTVAASSAIMSSGYTGEIATMVSNVSESIGGLDMSGETYDSAYNTIQGYINGLMETEGSATDEVSTFGDNALTTLNTALGEQSPSVYTQESGQNFVQGFVNGLATFQELVTPSLTAIQEFILAWLTSFGEQVTEIINTTFEPITSMFSTESFGETYDEISGFLEGKWEEFYATLQGWVAILSEYLLAERTLEYTNFTTWVTNLITYIQTEESLLQTNITTFVAAVNAIVESGESQFLTNLTTVLEQAKQLLQDFYDYIEGEWGPDLEDEFYDIGENSIGALQDGMESKFPELYDWIYDRMKEMKDKAAAALEIGSPSKVFMELGAFTAEGFGVGWENEIADVKEQVADDLDFSTASVDVGSSSLGSLARSGKGITVVQNIYSKAQSAADLLREARWQQERAVMTGV